MQDNVEQLRRRWTPEMTAEAVRALAVIEGVVGITVLGMLIASWTKKIMYR